MIYFVIYYWYLERGNVCFISCKIENRGLNEIWKVKGREKINEGGKLMEIVLV